MQRLLGLACAGAISVEMKLQCNCSEIHCPFSDCMKFANLNSLYDERQWWTFPG